MNDDELKEIYLHKYWYIIWERDGHTQAPPSVCYKQFYCTDVKEGRLVLYDRLNKVYFKGGDNYTFPHMVSKTPPPADFRYHEDIVKELKAIVKCLRIQSNLWNAYD